MSFSEGGPLLHRPSKIDPSVFTHIGWRRIQTRTARQENKQNSPAVQRENNKRNTKYGTVLNPFVFISHVDFFFRHFFFSDIRAAVVHRGRAHAGTIGQTVPREIPQQPRPRAASRDVVARGKSEGVKGGGDACIGCLSGWLAGQDYSRM